MTKGWIGVDLDGTLAFYDGWISPEHIGEPVPRMVERVLEWLGEGIEVRIMTARAYMADAAEIRRIQDWTEKHIGRRLPVTNQKDYSMIQLWDDRAVQVIPNTGVAVIAPPTVISEDQTND